MSMTKRRLQILLRAFLRLIGVAFTCLIFIYLALYNFDRPTSHIPFDIKEVKYGTANDARLNPDVLYIELKPGYSCSYSWTEDGKIKLVLDYGYATEKEYDGIKLHFYKKEIIHQKSEFEEILYKDLAEDEKLKVDNLIKSEVRINFVSKISRDFGSYPTHHPSRIMINNMHYSFVTTDGKDAYMQQDAIYNEAVTKTELAYQTINPKDGFLCTITLGAVSEIMNEETSVLGNSTLILDGFLETSLDYQKAGIKYSIFDANPKSLVNIVVRELKNIGIWAIIISILVISSLWAWPGVAKALFMIVKDGFNTLKTEGMGELLYITVKTYRDGSKSYEHTYENSGLFGGMVLLLILLPFVTPICGVIKSFITIFTDIFFFFYE